MAMTERSGERLITCIVPAGRGLRLLEALRARQGVADAAWHHARGVGATGRKRWLVEEKEVVTAVVPASRGEEVFAFLYREAGLDSPLAGLVFMHAAGRLAGTLLPDGHAPADEAQPNPG